MKKPNETRVKKQGNLADQAPANQLAESQSNDATAPRNDGADGKPDDEAKGNPGNGELSLANLRLPQNFAQTVSVKKHLLKVSTRKPTRHEFIRVHPTYKQEMLLLRLKEDREEIYAVDVNLYQDLQGTPLELELTPAALYVAINRQGVVFLIPVKLIGEDGRRDAWNETLAEAVEIAKERWVRVASNINAGCYEVYEATGKIAEPEFPQLSLEKLLALAFKTNYIDSLDHPVIQKLLGEI